MNTLVLPKPEPLAGRAWPWIALSLTAAYWSTLFILPLVALFATFGTSGSAPGVSADVWDLDLSIAGFTLRQAAASTAFSVALGLPLGAWLGARSRRDAAWHARICRSLLTVPWSVPTLVAAYAAVEWMSTESLVPWAYTVRGVIVAHVFLNAPLVALWVSGARAGLDESLLEAAASLGAGPWARFRYVAWPAIRTTVASAASQVFTLCMTSFAIVLLVGGGPPVESLETTVYSRIRMGGLDLAGASRVAMLQLLICLLPWGLALYLGSGSTAAITGEGASASPAVPSRSGRWLDSAARGILLALCALPIAPYVRIFAASMPTFWNDEIAHALALSVRLAAVSSVAAVAAGSASVLFLKTWRLGRGLAFGAQMLFAAPGGISILVVGLGFWMVYGAWLDPFEGSEAAIVLLQSITLIPLVVRLLWPLAEPPSNREWQAARVLGASPTQAFRFALWPRYRPAILSALGLGFSGAIGEVGVVSLFYSEKLVPMPLLISRWVAQYRFDDARALAVLLFLISVSVGTVAQWRSRT